MAEKKPLRKTLEALGRIGAPVLKSGVVGPGGVLLGNVLGGILGTKADDDDAIAEAISKATPEQVAQILEVMNKVKLEELAVERAEVEGVTSRWHADTATGYWLPNNIRPLTLASVLLFWFIWNWVAAAVVTYFFAVSGSADAIRSVDEGLADFFTSIGVQISTLLGVVVAGYFGARSFDKTRLK